jgi:hypothetical protein
VNDCLIADLLDIEARTSCAEWAEADGDPKHPIDLREDRGEFQCSKRRRKLSRRDAGAVASTTAETGNARGEKNSPVHTARE